MPVKAQDTKEYDVQYRLVSWPDGPWTNLGHPTTDRAKAESLARGSKVVEPEFEYQVVELP